MTEPTITLYRPTGPKELDLVAASGYKKWPPRLPEQPIFYPVTNEAYAREIATQWNIKESGAGFVTRFQVKKSFIWITMKRIKLAVQTTPNGGFPPKTWMRSTQISLV